MPTVLDKIVATKWQEIAAAKAARPVEKLERIAEAAPPRETFSRPSRRRGRSN